ncbi:MAG: GNAT family N-acetyltransferase [Eubacteriales bacterium]|nr:GNAT family N-acetyltransferase [Eubacteriales bacterium]
MAGGELPDKNLFMMCRQLNTAALTALPAGYTLRNCRQDELSLWAAFPFDTPQQAHAGAAYMEDYFARVYGAKRALFFDRCRFVCDARDMPVATCFIWPAYGRIRTLHWLKVRRDHEGRGVGRALLSAVLGELTPGDYPVYLHTQPESYRAIKLYSDLGFALLTDPIIGRRRNHLEECLPLLQQLMPPDAYARLRFDSAPAALLAAAASSAGDEF